MVNPKYGDKSSYIINSGKPINPIAINYYGNGTLIGISPASHSKM